MKWQILNDTKQPAIQFQLIDEPDTNDKNRAKPNDRRPYSLVGVDLVVSKVV